MAALGGCTSAEMVNTIANPGKYNIDNCELLNKRDDALLKRELELKTLMDKAAQGPGGGIAVAVAYKTDYTMLQGDLREIEIAALNKNCPLKHRPISGQIVR